MIVFIVTSSNWGGGIPDVHVKKSTEEGIVYGKFVG